MVQRHLISRLFWPCAMTLLFSLPAQAAMLSGIVGGSTSVEGAWPWMVSLESAASSSTPYAAHFCGGALVGEAWVLTAAHCVLGKEPGTLVVRVDGNDLRSSSTAGTLAKIDRILVHPSYHPATYNHDLALLHLSSAVNIEPLTPIGYSAMAAMASGTNLMIMGWGATSAQNSNSYPYQLQQVTLPLIADSVCSAAYPGAITENMVCAGLMSGGKDSCYGDSGGPLVVGTNSSNAQQVGIVSWGNGCASPGAPGVYTRLANYTDWLNQHQQHLSMDTHTDFGYLPLGYRLTRQIQVFNDGLSPAMLTNLLLDTQQGFSVTADSCVNSSLVAGASCAITVGFTGTVVGQRQETVVATDSGSAFELRDQLSATVLPKVSFSNAITSTMLDWYTGGDANWSDGKLSGSRLPLVAGSGLTDGVAVLQTTITGPATLSFEWNVVGGDGYTLLTHRLDGIALSSATNNSWRTQTLSVPAGSHLVDWRFTKSSLAPTLAEAKLANLVITAASSDSTTDSSSNNSSTPTTTNPSTTNTATTTTKPTDSPNTTTSSSSGGGSVGWGALLVLAGVLGRRRRGCITDRLWG